MNKSDRKFWPFKPCTSIVATIVILVGLLIICVILRKAVDWPAKDSETTMLIGVMVLGLLPIVLAFIDIFIERGGMFEYRGMKINFSEIPKWGASELTVSFDNGLPNQLVNTNDNDIDDILKALRKSKGCDVVIIDLKNGQGFLETHLLILIAGAVRIKKPEKIVFVGTDGRIDKTFLGWSHPNELLPFLLRAHPQYKRSYNNAKAKSKKCEPATEEQSMTYDENSRLQKEFQEEKFLAIDLCKNVKIAEERKPISIIRLDDLFRPVLYKESMDESKESRRNENSRCSDS